MKLIGHGNRNAEIHGASKTPEYLAWKAMNWRCNPKNKHSRYFAKGISICPEWGSFSVFLRCIGPMPNPGMEVDRWPDNKGNYGPGNVRWANRIQQMANTSTAMKITIGGRTECASEWARIAGIPLNTIRYRVRRQWPESELLSKRLWKHRVGRCA